MASGHKTSALNNPRVKISGEPDSIDVKPLIILFYVLESVAESACCKYLLYKINALLQVHAKVNELPLDAFFLVLLLLEHEHVMVEELLKSFVRVVDTQLFERIVLYRSK